MDLVRGLRKLYIADWQGLVSDREYSPHETSGRYTCSVCSLASNIFLKSAQFVINSVLK